MKVRGLLMIDFGDVAQSQVLRRVLLVVISESYQSCIQVTKGNKTERVLFPQPYKNEEEEREC